MRVKGSRFGVEDSGPVKLVWDNGQGCQEDARERKRERERESERERERTRASEGESTCERER